MAGKELSLADIFPSQKGLKLEKTVDGLLHCSPNEEIARLNSALEISEQKFEDMFQLSPIPICFLRLDGKTVELMNRRFAELIGATGSSMDVEKFISPEELERLFEKFRKFKDGKAKEQSLDTAFIHQETGKVIPITMFASQFFIGDQETIVVGAMDMTERKKLLNTDALTGVLNRRGLMEQLDKEIQRARRYKHPLSIAMIDIDRFKEVNDSCGHAMGDTVLQQLAQKFQDSIRTTDFIGRIGGDEFILLFLETSEEGACHAMKQKQIAIQCAHESKKVVVTVSIGIASFDADVLDVDVLLDQADKALYVAKDAGGDKIVRYSELNVM